MEMEIYKVDGTIEKVTTDADNVTLEELYKAIDTDIVEVCYLAENMLFILDENGKLKGSKMNEKATKLFYEKTKRYDDCIVGNAVLIDRKYLR